MKELKLLLRTAILLQLQAASPIAISMKTILCGLKLAGFDIDETQLLKHLDYLEKKGFVLAKREEISQGDLRYSLSLVAMEYLEQRGF
ncbi:MAG: hypothetical protein R3Y46_07665 [Opitutales bacterium]